MAATEGIALALLAAGASRRFGDTDKLAAPLAGRPVIEWAARAGVATGARRRFVIVPPDSALDLTPLGYEVFINAQAGEGLASSLRLAAAAAEDAGATALLIMLADMPLIDPAHLDKLITAFSQNGTRAIFSQAAGGVPQPPALFPARFFPVFDALSGDAGARRLAEDAVIVEATADLLLDVDTPADLERAHALLLARRERD